MIVEDAERYPLATPPKVGDLGRYRLIAELARGGMGVVFLALVRGPGGFNKLFVVKELKQHLGEDPDLVDMFLEEARLAAKLNHPNVVQTIEVGSDGDRHFIAMEYLDGQSLHRLITRVRRAGVPFPLHHHLYILVQMLEGLQYAHGVTDFDGSPLSLVHRDVSPHNIFITYDGQVKLLDFGIAKALDSAHDTRTGMLKGKVSYMAPEQSSGQASDRRADLFSAGVMLWEAAVGHRMWSKSQNDLQILHALTSGAIPRPRDAKGDIDPGLERMILKGTAVKPGDRYASAAELQADLEAFLKDLAPPGFGARDVGKFVSDVFTLERGQIKAVIDDQLRRLRGSPSGEYGAIDLPRLSVHTAPYGTPSGVLVRATRSSPVPPLRAPFDIPIHVDDTKAALFAAPAGGRAPWVVALLAASLAVLAGVLVFALRRPHATHASGAAPAPPPPTTLAPSEPARPLSQPAAVVAVDGGPQTLEPADGASALRAARSTPDGASALRAARSTPEEEAVAAPPPRHHHGRSEVHVTPPPEEPSVAPSAPPPAAQPAAQPIPVPSGTAHGKQQIDTRDPYATDAN